MLSTQIMITKCFARFVTPRRPRHAESGRGQLTTQFGVVAPAPAATRRASPVLFTGWGDSRAEGFAGAVTRSPVRIAAVRRRAAGTPSSVRRLLERFTLEETSHRAGGGRVDSTWWREQERSRATATAGVAVGRAGRLGPLRRRLWSGRDGRKHPPRGWNLTGPSRLKRGLGLALSRHAEPASAAHRGLLIPPVRRSPRHGRLTNPYGGGTSGSLFWEAVTPGSGGPFAGQGEGNVQRTPGPPTRGTEGFPSNFVPPSLDGG